MTLDPRLNAYRPDLADVALKGKVESARFIAGTPRRAVAPSAPLKQAPRNDAPLASGVLRGEVFTVFQDTPEGWSWGQLETDRYVGYVPTDSLGGLAPEPTHRIAALRTFIYPGPDMKLPAIAALSFGARLALGRETVTRNTSYREIAGGQGWLVAVAAEPVSAPPANDFVAVAERFLGVAYLWGGRTSVGLDCSALVQLALMAAGKNAPRDTDLQEKMLGVAVEGGIGARLHRGDLVFWKGHVGIMIDGEYLLHATSHQMAVVIEPLPLVVERILKSGNGPPTSIRRLASK